MICCPKPVRAFAMRVQRLDQCGRPVTTPNSQVTTTAFVSLQAAPDIENGQEILVRNAKGDICIQDQECDRLKGFKITLDACGVPMPMLEMLLGMDMLMDGADIIGGVMPDRNSTTACEDSFAVTLWSKNADKGACDANGEPYPYVQWEWVRMFKFQLSGNLEYKNGELMFQLSGYAENNPNWLPAVTAEWDPAHVTQIENGGPVAFKCVTSIPDTDDCAYSV